MATIARFQAVVKMGNTKMTGFTAWVAWCFLHLLYIVGFKSQVGTLVNWFFSFLSGARSQRTTTNQQLVGHEGMLTKILQTHCGAGSKSFQPHCHASLCLNACL